MSSVLTIGSATRDVFLFSKAFKVMPMPHQPNILAEYVTLGAKIDLDNLMYATGGGATNAAATFARLGLTTSIMTRIGDDESGRAVLADLATYNINTALITIAKKELTAYSTLLTTESGERTALVFRGASANFTEKDVKLSKINTDAVYLTSLGGDTALALSVAKTCKQKGTIFVWNPGAAELKAGRGLNPIRKLAHILLLNVEEAQLLSGKSIPDPKKQCEILALPGSIVVVTDGANGAFAHNEKHTWHCRTSGSRATSSTGAGDAFGSAFTAGIMHGMTIEDALRLGTMNAESVVQQIGAKAGILRALPKASELAMYRVRNV
jgi:sugar/nucleoside kinase (ribokinase family)